MKELNKIYNENCLVGMKEIPDASIDCIITDLPYEVLNKNNNAVSWDRVIPFEPLWEQYLRVIKNNGAIVLFAQGMFTAKLMMSQPYIWRYNLVWSKGRATGFLNANRMPMRSHEDICVFYKSQPTYNPQFRDVDSHSQGNGVHKQTNQCYGKFKTGSVYEYAKGSIKVVPPTGKGFPDSIIRINKEHSDIAWHPTQKPVDLIRYLILTYTNEKDTVLDSCMGSGTTAVACIKERRNFIGFEISKEYFDKANKRIQQEQQQLNLFDL